jgi:hypothetical protein
MPAPKDMSDSLLDSHPGLDDLALWVREAVLAGEPAAVPHSKARPSRPNEWMGLTPQAVLQLSGWPGSAGAMGIEDEVIPR